MKRYMFLCVLAASVMLCACRSEKNDSENDTGRTQEESIVKEDQSAAGNTDADKAQEVVNSLTYEQDGDPVTDPAVFGDNAFVFSPDDSADEVQDKVDEIYAMQKSNQFGENRFALMFMPGEYDESLNVNVGFYTQVLGLGVLPTETNIRKLWTDASWMNHNATCNFWRSVENFSIDEYCMWANSQAVSMRRINSGNGIVLSDGQGWSSGGFIADSYFNGLVSSGSQQQYLFRNDDWNYYENGVWNMVFTGVNVNKIPTGNWPYVPYTRVENTPVVQEKPYLAYEKEHGFGVIVPERRTDCQGISWKEGQSGTFISLNKFYIATPDDDAAKINEALESGKHILFTPGIYKLDEPVVVSRPDTVLYGMGLATLVAESGNACMKLADVDGIKICGLLFEAGNTESETLLQAGEADSSESHADDPICFSDVYFRVGGAGYAGKVKNCVTIYSSDVLCDHFWVWRADHGSNVGWDVNTAKNGMIVEGDNVTAYGLFVEHFEEYQTIWNGNGGKLIFYQSELPYDAPDQESYKSHDGSVNGYASFKVGDGVTDFEGWGLGIYCYNRDADITIDHAAELPETDGVKLHNICTVKLNGQGQIAHIVNDDGGAASHGGSVMRIKDYENGIKEN